MISKIRNAQMVGKDHILLPFSKMKFSLAGILKDNGFVSDFERRKKKGKKGDELEYLEIKLKYNDDKSGAISGLKLISKPSRRMYLKAKEIKKVRSGYGIAIISTPKGVLSSKEARKKNVGGEILFEVW